MGYMQIIRDLSIIGFWYPWGTLEPVSLPHTEGQLYIIEFHNRVLSLCLAITYINIFSHCPSS